MWRNLRHSGTLLAAPFHDASIQSATRVLFRISHVCADESRYCKALNVSAPFISRISRSKQNREIKGRKYQLQAGISNCMVLIRQKNERGQNNSACSVANFWGSQIKGFYSKPTVGTSRLHHVIIGSQRRGWLLANVGGLDVVFVDTSFSEWWSLGAGCVATVRSLFGVGTARFFFVHFCQCHSSIVINSIIIFTIVISRLRAVTVIQLTLQWLWHQLAKDVNPFKPSGVKWLHFKASKVILV